MTFTRPPRPPRLKAIVGAILTLVAAVSFYAQCGCSVQRFEIQCSLTVEEFDLDPLPPI